MRRSTKAASITVAALSGAVIAGTLYLVCVAWDLLVPGYAMRAAWAPLLPGFVWLTWGGFLLGLAESFTYGALLGWLIAWVPTTVAKVVRNGPARKKPAQV